MSEPFYIVGHRGAAGERLENSLEGFRHAIELGIDAIELDIREHSGRLWVFHDAALNRVTEASGSFAGTQDPGAIRLRNGEPIPTLDALLDLTWGRLPLNIEIKSIEHPELLLELLASRPRPPSRPGIPWVLISSFNHRVLLQLRELGCDWPLAPIDSGIPLDYAHELEALAPWSWHFDDEYLDFTLVAALRERGVPSLVFTVNDAARARELRAGGVAGIFTDLPTKLRQID